MATHEIDRKVLGHLAYEAGLVHRDLSAALYQILGLSKLLSRRLMRARLLRRIDATDEKAMMLYHHIIWMSREGLRIDEEIISRFVERNLYGVRLKIFAYKLRASFYHVFCLFHNKPSVSSMNPVGGSPTTEAVPTTALLPLPPNQQTRLGSTPPRHEKNQKEPNEPSPPSATNRPGVRDSVLSDTSNVTNPFGSVPALSPPPGLSGSRNPTAPAADSAAFLLPSTNFLPMTVASFDNAANLAAKHLSGSSPLRLSIALEYTAFKWDCLHDHDASRALAKHTIRAVYAAQEGMDDHEFEDAATLVSTLGRMMKRTSLDATPRSGPESPRDAADNGGPSTTTGDATPTPPPAPDLPPISSEQEAALRRKVQVEQENARREAEAQPPPPPPPRPTPAPRSAQSTRRPQTTTATSAFPNPQTSKPIMVRPPNNPPPPVAVTSSTASTPPRPSTSGKPDISTEKPLPDLPRDDPSFRIPRRPVGTPPSVRSGSRPGTSGEESGGTVTPARSRGGLGQSGRAQSPDVVATEQGGTSARRARQTRAPKRKNEGGDEGDGGSSGGRSGRSGRSMIPRLRVRNP